MSYGDTEKINDFVKRIIHYVNQDDPSVVASTPWKEPRSHCQNGGHICLAGNKDGTCCPDDSCDIDDGLKSRDPRATISAPASR